MKTIGKVTILPIGKRAEIHNIWITSTVFCRKYVGKFLSVGLQSKAETGLWFCSISGNPHSIQGEGHTPFAAMDDARRRNLDMINKLQQANSAIADALVATIREN